MTPSKRNKIYAKIFSLFDYLEHQRTAFPKNWKSHNIIRDQIIKLAKQLDYGS